MQSSVAKVRQAIGALTRAGRDATGDRPSRPAIPTTPDETGLWLTAPAEAALQRQRPLPSDALTIVARGERASDRAA